MRRPITPFYKCLDLSYLLGTQCKTYFMAYNLLQALIHVHAFSFVLVNLQSGRQHKHETVLTLTSLAICRSH